MKRKFSLHAALVSILAAATVGAGAPGLAQSNVIVISGSGRNLHMSERAPVNQSVAEKRNEEFTAGYNSGYADGARAGYQQGYKLAYNRVLTGTTKTALNASVPTTGYGGTTEFQRGYRSGYRVGFDQAFNSGSLAGNSAAVAAVNSGTAVVATTPASPVVVTDPNAINALIAEQQGNVVPGTGFVNPVIGGGGSAASGVNNVLVPGGTTGINAGVNNLASGTLPNGTTLTPNVTVPNSGFNNGFPAGFQNTGFQPGNFSNNFTANGNLVGSFLYGFNNGVNNGLTNFTSPFTNGFNNVTGFNSNFNNNLANFNNLYGGTFNSNLRQFTGGLGTTAVTTGTATRR